MSEENTNTNLVAPAPATVAKPGWRSSEFWLTLTAHVLTALVLSGAFDEAHWAVKIASIGLSALAQLGYTASRAFVKKP